MTGEVIDFNSRATERAIARAAAARVDIPKLEKDPRKLFVNVWFAAGRFPSTGRAMTFDTPEAAIKSAHDWTRTGQKPDLIAVRIVEPKKNVA